MLIHNLLKRLPGRALIISRKVTTAPVMSSSDAEVFKGFNSRVFFSGFDFSAFGVSDFGAWVFCSGFVSPASESNFSRLFFRTDSDLILFTVSITLASTCSKESKYCPIRTRQERNHTRLYKKLARIMSLGEVSWSSKAQSLQR